MSDDISKTERQLKSSAGETPDLKSVIGERDPDEVDVYGWQVIYTTGDFTMPREDLLDKMDDVGLPEWMAPGKVQPHRAFSRVVDEAEEEFEEFRNPDGDKVRVEFESGESHYEQHVHARVWYGPDEDDADATGQWVDQRLGVIRYEDKDVRFDDFGDLTEGSWFHALFWDGIVKMFDERFARHQELHNGDDVNNMVYYLCRQWTDAVKLRDSCYFVPGSYEDIEEFIDGFRALYEWINENHKTRGQKTELFAMSIVDAEREREMLKQKVQEEMEDEVGVIFDQVLDQVKERDVDDIAEDVIGEMKDVHGLMEAHSANDEMKAALSVKQAIRRSLQDLDDEREEVVDRVLAEAGIPYAEDDELAVA